ncbi:hypothetical protein HDE69_001008 [Pedobacter cryoconitis]|uniref:Protein-glutamine gamma-glutamyltransferase-like C-terminal domain-containing protein n=1 Tax=Pedobacter cryoconitis TaxID=188932 RepID=A0A7W8YQK8_9SPHI|nr:DUF4129 domain-containing protein [Pedobacter cryoconitis]MBB5619970.1 hypothetical protein [Pedobacter cryoconitis]
MFKYLGAFLFVLTVQFFPVQAKQSVKTSLAVPAKVSLAVPAKVKPLRSDSSKIQLRSFDAQKLKSYSQQTDFKYDQPAPIDASLWDRFWAWFWRKLSGVARINYSVNFFRYIIIAAFIALIVFVVIKFTGVDFKLFMGKSKAVAIPYAESTDNIHEIDFNTEIDQAIQSANYRLAVRLMYLLSLKKLNSRNLINWQPEKTNQTYIREIADPQQRAQFSLLTTQFEYIWYGEFFIDQENFKQVRNSYDQFNTALS